MVSIVLLTLAVAAFLLATFSVAIGSVPLVPLGLALFAGGVLAAHLPVRPHR